MQVVQEPNYYGGMAQNLANSLSNMLGFGPQQQWQGLLQSLGQSGLIPQNLNLNALGSLQNPQMQEVALKLLGQQSMSPLEQAQTGLYGAETEKARAETQMLGQPDISKMQGTASGLRKEFDALSAPYRLIQGSYSRMMASAEDPSPAGDVAIIFNFMKMIDPPSTVREGEAATVENARGWGDAARSLYNRVLTGEKLTETQRQDFLSRSEKLYKSQEKTHKDLINRYTGLSNRWGISPEDVITEANEPQQAGQMPLITSEAEYIALPMGATYRDNSGNIGVKK